MAAAKAIAMKHQIDLASIPMGEDKQKRATMQTDKATVKIRSKHIRPYHKYVCGILSNVFGIRVITVWNSFVFIGEATDVAICTMLFPWLENTIWDTYYAVRRARGETCHVCGTANAVFLGFYHGILEVNRKAEEQLSKKDGETWALVLVDKKAIIEKRVEEEFPMLRKGRASKERSYTPGCYQHGYVKGKTINLRQVGSGSGPAGELA